MNRVTSQPSGSTNRDHLGPDPDLGTRAALAARSDVAVDAQQVGLGAAHSQHERRPVDVDPEVVVGDAAAEQRRDLRRPARPEALDGGGGFHRARILE